MYEYEKQRVIVAWDAVTIKHTRAANQIGK
jgi:hypothetical protein